MGTRSRKPNSGSGDCDPSSRYYACLVRVRRFLHFNREWSLPDSVRVLTPNLAASVFTHNWACSSIAGKLLRILHLIATLDERSGGPANSVRSILRAYPSSGSVGEVVTLDSPDAEYLVDLDFVVHALGPAYRRLGRFGYSSRLIPWLRANMERFDGMVLHGLWQYLGVAVRLVVAGRKPYMVFPHGMLDPYFKSAYPGKHRKKAFYWILQEYWVLRGARFVLFTSQAEASLARKTFGWARWNARVIPYGASPPEGDPGLLREAFLAEHSELRHEDLLVSDSFGLAKPFVLFLGRIHEKKGCDMLLEAFGGLAGRDPELQLVFAGPDGDGLVERLRGRVLELGEDRVHFLGMLEGQQKWGALSACEVFALPSHQENFGIAVAEALACGRPVLISDKVNIWEDVLADGAGLAGTDDEAGTESTLLRWVTMEPEDRAAMSRNALQCFASRYDMRVNARKIVSILTDLPEH